MKRRPILAMSAIALAVFGTAVIREPAPAGAQSPPRVRAGAPPPPAAAEALERKILAIEAAAGVERASRETVRVSEVELESYVYYRMQEEIPVRLDSVDLEIRPGLLAATTDMFVDSDLRASHPIVGPLFEGQHSVFFEGAFEARDGRGAFRLQRVRVDGVAVPVFLVKALLGSFEEPIDLDTPFDTPLGIDEVVLLERSVSVTY